MSDEKPKAWKIHEFVIVPRAAVNELGHSVVRHVFGTASTYTFTDAARVGKAIDDIVACADPPKPKDEILEALKDAQHLLQTGDPRVIPHVSVDESYKRSRAAVDRAIELREREIERGKA